MSTASLLMPTRVLIVGGGGREHALAWKLGAEPGVNEVIVAPGSARDRARAARALRSTSTRSTPTPSSPLARRVSAELVVVGPEAPLAAGVADALTAAGIAVFGPSQAAARIESSKAFCHEVAAAAGVRMARAATFTTSSPRWRSPASSASAGDGVVVKADGLAAGKGVTVCDGLDDAHDGARRRPWRCRAPGSSSRSGCAAARRASSPSRTAAMPWRCRSRATTSACATA